MFDDQHSYVTSFTSHYGMACSMTHKKTLKMESAKRLPATTAVELWLSNPKNSGKVLMCVTKKQSYLITVTRRISTAGFMVSGHPRQPLKFRGARKKETQVPNNVTARAKPDQTTAKRRQGPKTSLHNIIQLLVVAPPSLCQELTSVATIVHA